MWANYLSTCQNNCRDMRRNCPTTWYLFVDIDGERCGDKHVCSKLVLLDAGKLHSSELDGPNNRKIPEERAKRPKRDNPHPPNLPKRRTPEHIK